MSVCVATTEQTKKGEDWAIIHMLERGITNREMANRLQLTENQVKYRIYKVMRTKRIKRETKTFDHINLYLSTDLLVELIHEAGKEGISLNRHITYILRCRVK